MRGTQYRSPTEREWFLDNCVTPTPPPAFAPAVAPAVAPAGSVSVVPPPPPARGPAPVISGSLQGVRVWTNGDSTSYFMSISFLQIAAGMGAVSTQPAAEYQISSGLLNPGYFSWPAYLASEMASKQPDVVVFMIGANDAYVGMPLDTYHQRVGEVMDQLSDRRLIWVGQPNMGRADLTASIPSVNAVFQQEAAGRAWVTFVDTWSITSDQSGNYAQYLPDENGVLQQIRASDGVHFTPEGGRRLAIAVISAVLSGT